MAVFEKGTFRINLGFVQFSGELTDEDRQCAWEFYTELTSRMAVFGKLDEQGEPTFEGEVLVESFNSLYQFFLEARGIMRSYPVGRIGIGHETHLGYVIAKILEVVIRPFLEKWQAVYHFWWEHESNEKLSPFERQKAFPHLEELQSDWGLVRTFCRTSAKELAEIYKFVAVYDLIPSDIQQTWLEERKNLIR